MTVYSYRCEACGHEEEFNLSMDKRDSGNGEPCESCADGVMLRTVAYGGFQLKGNCWARDGYATRLGDDPRYQAGTRNPTED